MKRYKVIIQVNVCLKAKGKGEAERLSRELVDGALKSEVTKRMEVGLSTGEAQSVASLELPF